MMENNYGWHFADQRPTDVSGQNLAEENFNRESRGIENIFLREFNQNVLDARTLKVNGEKDLAEIVVRVIEKESGLNVGKFKEIFFPLEDHLTAGGHPITERNWDSPKVLIIEEFKTTGLTGTVQNSRAKGEEERWSNFWFAEGKPSKSGGSLGRKGEGKITYHVISGARSVLAVTRREAENKDYLFGKCIVRNTHEIDGSHFINHGYWPFLDENGQPMPEDNQSKIEEIKKIFGLKRTVEPGTSWIIPFVTDNFSEEVLVREFVTDFFFSVLSENLVAEICGREINSSNIKEISNNCGIEKPSAKFFDFMEETITTPEQHYIIANKDWYKNIFENKSFKEFDHTELQKRFDNNEIISVKAPINLTKIDGQEIQTEIKLHIQGGIEHGNLEEAYVRSGLNIVNENHLKSETQSAFGIMLAQKLGISEFLGYCEEASHLNWKNNAKEAKRRYENVETTVRKVRQSLPMLYSFFSSSAQTKSDDAFTDILGVPIVKGGKRTRKKSKLSGPPRLKKPKLLDGGGKIGNWELFPGKDASNNKESFPLKVKITLAYDRISGNPLGKYHPFDFDLSDNKFKPIVCENIIVEKVEFNKMSLSVISHNFNLMLEGFNTEIPVFSKIEYND